MQHLASRSQRGFTLIELMIVVTIIGILAAVAIPSFQRVIRRSKTAEAPMNLRKIYDGAASYYAAEPVNRIGSILQPVFPASVGPTPAANHCCNTTGTKCAPEPNMFNNPSWQAVNFDVNDPFYYWYTLQTAGTGLTAQFTARANGNLDCDAVHSTFERLGLVDLRGNVTGSAGMYKRNELE